MRFLRRNALGVYAVYAAAIVSGLVVTPVVIHSIGKDAFGIWSFIGSATIFLSLLDLGVGPSIVRFGAEARGRRATDDVNEIASAGLALYGAITLASVPIGLVLAWIVPILVDAPDDLLWESRIATLLVVVGIWARFPLGLFNNLLVARQRWDLQNLANLVSTVLYAVLVATLLPTWGGLVLLAALSLGATLLRLAIPLAWLQRRAARAADRAPVRHAHADPRAGVVQLVELPRSHREQDRLLDRRDRRRHRPRRGRLGGLRRAGEAVRARVRHRHRGHDAACIPRSPSSRARARPQRQRRLLLTGLRGGSALMLLLALPFILIPDLLIHAWIGDGYEDAYTVLALLGGRAPRPPADLRADAVPDRAGAAAAGGADLDRSHRHEPRGLGRAGVDGRALGRRGLDPRHGRQPRSSS